MKELELTQGYKALVDDEDYERCVAAGPWFAYVERRKDGTIRNVYGARSGIVKRLHRFILDVVGPKVQVDHKDHNGLNCQHHNMRVVTNFQNSRNTRKRSGTTSSFKGVYRYKLRNNWRAMIRLNNKNVGLGYFSEELAAALAYDASAREHFGEFAHTNF